MSKILSHEKNQQENNSKYTLRSYRFICNLTKNYKDEPTMLDTKLMFNRAINCDFGVIFSTSKKLFSLLLYETSSA